MRTLILIPLLLLAACGPSLRTDYTLTAPVTPQGKQCANNCFYVRQGCVNACEYSRHNCPASTGFHGGVGFGRARHFAGVGYGSPWHDDFDRSCHFNATACEQDCETQYRQCFTNCGGKVTATTTCVENCTE